MVVTKLDRLARSVAHLCKIIDTLESKGVDLKILNLNLETGTATGKLMLTMLGAVAEFEREMMLERQREGIAKAKSAGKSFGRPATAKLKANQVQELRETGLGATEIAKKLGISRSSVYRHSLHKQTNCQSTNPHFKIEPPNDLK
jgi:DNA invertase Pin-like site-specific DNA recombinase